MAQFELLFSPIKIGNMELDARVIMSPMQTNYADEEGYVTEQLIAYHVARAKGRVAYNMTGQTTVALQGRYNRNMLCLYDDRYIPGFAKLADAIHEAGGKLVIQLNHCGPKADPKATGMPLLGPSPIQEDPKSAIPVEISEEGISKTILDFVQASLRAKRAGADGIELHMAHSYLMSSFLTSHMNKREDAYGGDIQGRMRFPLEVLTRVREAVGEDYPIVCRFSMGEFKDTGIPLEEALILAKALEERGADALHVSVYKDATAPYYMPQGHLIHLATAVKEVVNIPVIGVGRIVDPEYAEQVLREGKVDVIALGRQLMADPEFPTKVKEGRLQDIIPCIGCNSGCIGRHITYFSSCISNPRTGYEAATEVKVAEKEKKVAVIGGGPAGIQTALTASARGHEVVLYEKGPHLGGNFSVASLPDGKEDLKRLLTYWENALKKSSVKVLLNAEASAERIGGENPEVVVVATGAFPFHPDIPGIDDERVIQAVDVLSKGLKTGQRVLVAGGGEVGLEVADHLARQGKEVIVIEMLGEVGSDVPKNTKPVLLERLGEGGVDLRTNTTLRRIEEGSVFVEKNGQEGTIEGIDNVILALGFTSDQEIVRDLQPIFKEVHVIGDAREVRQAVSAVREGFELACTL
ncbi:MAG: FAD-dependent oxidoreductase [Proteobacteria bacterium]|nr:FAD-dependent oxidoreductase [Pseudomonadota bacterium]